MNTNPQARGKEIKGYQPFTITKTALFIKRAKRVYLKVKTSNVIYLPERNFNFAKGTF